MGTDASPEAAVGPLATASGCSLGRMTSACCVPPLLLPLAAAVEPSLPVLSPSPVASGVTRSPLAAAGDLALPPSAGGGSAEEAAGALEPLGLLTLEDSSSACRHHMGEPDE